MATWLDLNSLFSTKQYIDTDLFTYLPPTPLPLSSLSLSLSNTHAHTLSLSLSCAVRFLCGSENLRWNFPILRKKEKENEENVENERQLEKGKECKNEVRVMKKDRN